MHLMHLYWPTRFITPQHKRTFISSGSAVVLVLTTRCTFKCAYCPMYLPTGKQPHYNECTIDEWKKFISEYPHWIEEFFISGGETTLYPQLAEFVNWLVDRGHHVCLFSNLWKPEALFGVNKSYRFVLYPTYHEYDSRERFEKAYRVLEGRFRIHAIEFDGRNKFSFTKIKQFFSRQWFTDEMRLHFAPDSPRTKRIYTACFQLYKDGVK